MKLLREPLVQFFLIGGTIYLLYGLTVEPAEDTRDNTLVVEAGEIEWLTTAWQKRWSRPPTNQELDGLIQQYVRETVLYREALAMGLDKDDTIIRRRLAQKLEFLAQDLVALAPPTDEDLKTWFDEHRQRYHVRRIAYTAIQRAFGEKGIKFAPRRVIVEAITPESSKGGDEAKAAAVLATAAAAAGALDTEHVDDGAQADDRG